MAKEIAKQVSLSKEMWAQTQFKIKQLGIGFPEYVRHLILKDTKEIRDNRRYMSDELAKGVQEARDEAQNREYIKLASKEDIKKYIKELIEEND